MAVFSLVKCVCVCVCVCVCRLSLVVEVANGAILMEGQIHNIMHNIITALAAS